MSTVSKAAHINIKYDGVDKSPHAVITGERLSGLLRDFGISADSLSHSGMTSLRTLSIVGNKLGLNEMRSGV